MVSVFEPQIDLKRLIIISHGYLQYTIGSIMRINAGDRQINDVMIKISELMINYHHMTLNHYMVIIDLFAFF